MTAWHFSGHKINITHTALCYKAHDIRRVTTNRYIVSPQNNRTVPNGLTWAHVCLLFTQQAVGMKIMTAVVGKYQCDWSCLACTLCPWSEMGPKFSSSLREAVPRLFQYKQWLSYHRNQPFRFLCMLLLTRNMQETVYDLFPSRLNQNDQGKLANRLAKNRVLCIL